LFDDIEKDCQTKKEWEDSFSLLQQYLLLDKSNPQ